jgi:hypothetical protein
LVRIWIKDNPALGQRIEHLLIRPDFGNDGRPDVRYHDFEYQAARWRKPRRIVAMVSWFPHRLLPAPGFIVTNLNWAARRVTHFYNQRGTAEQWIKEGEYPLSWTRLSCRGFAEDRVRPQLFALAYNLGNFLLRLALPPSIRQWSLRTLKLRLIEIGAKVVRHAGYTCFQMAKTSVPRPLFLAILTRIRRLLEPVPI